MRRRTKEIEKYLDEAFDKVWLMRTHECEESFHELKRRYRNRKQY